MVIALTGLNAIDSPGPGVAVARALRDGIKKPIRIIGLVYENLEPGIYLHDLIDKSYQVPYPSAGISALLKRLEHIHAQEKLDLIIPNFDAELFNYIKLAPVLMSFGIRVFLPTLEQFQQRDKPRLKEFGEKHGMLVPDEKVINSVNELKSCEEKFGFPLVVKGLFYEAVIANSPDAAEKAFYKISAKWGVPVIVQKFIKGTELNVAVLGDGRGNAISIIPMKKLYITDKGKAWAGITLEDESLIELAKKFVTATNWKSGCELEIMRTDDGQLYIMEINPRFPAWIYLSAAAGQNQPAALAAMAMGEEVKPYDEYEAGKIFIRYAWDHITDINEFQQIAGKGEL